MKKNNKNIIYLGVVCIIIIILISYFSINGNNRNEIVDINTIYENDLENEIGEKNQLEVEKAMIIVHVSGAVKNEGIIEIPQNSRIADAIEMAGGITDQADLSKVNLAYVVSDGQKINIPNIYDKKERIVTDDAGESVIPEDDKNSDIKININSATQTELETLNGIGPSTALKIITYKKEKGKFNNIEELMNVPGIGESKFNLIKEKICVK